MEALFFFQRARQRILHSDWLLARARFSYMSASGTLPETLLKKRMKPSIPSGRHSAKDNLSPLLIFLEPKINHIKVYKNSTNYKKNRAHMYKQNNFRIVGIGF